MVVNAAGPWIDHVNAALGAPSKLIGGTKGSHILIKHDELVRTLAGRMIYFEADDGRICLVYEYLGHALVGSTDIKADNPDRVRCEDERSTICSRACARCCRASPSSASRSSMPTAASAAARLRRVDARAHQPRSFRAGRRGGRRAPFPIVSLVGGKWTTFRGFAEEVADAVLARLQRPRKATTREMPIGGGRDFPQNAAARARWLAEIASAARVDERRLDRLLSRYGTTARRVAGHHSAAWSDDERLPDSRDYGLAEIDYIARNEFVEHLADIVMRRTTLAIGGSLTLNDLSRIAAVAGGALGWDARRREEEIDMVVGQLSGRNLMRLELVPETSAPAP